MMNMACLLFSMRPEEVFAAVTKYAAQALAMTDTHGTLAIGKVASFAFWDIKHPLDLMAQFGVNHCIKDKYE